MFLLSHDIFIVWQNADEHGSGTSSWYCVSCTFHCEYYPASVNKLWVILSYITLYFLVWLCFNRCYQLNVNKIEAAKNVFEEFLQCNPKSWCVIYLSDQRRNEFEVSVGKRKNKVHFTQSWDQLGAHYKLILPWLF